MPTHKRASKRPSLKNLSNLQRQTSTQTDEDKLQQAVKRPSLSADNILQLQRTLGNQFTRQYIQRTRAQENDAITEQKLLIPQHRQQIQRDIITTEEQDDTVEEDIITNNNEGLEKNQELPEQDNNEQERQQGFGFIDEDVEETIDPKAQNAYDKFETLYNEYLYYNKRFMDMDPKYTDHTKRLQMLREIRGAIQNYLDIVGHVNDPGTNRIRKTLADVNAMYVEASPNAERAKTALRELLQIKDNDESDRLTYDLIQTMVLGVASPINESNDKGQGSIIGIQDAVDAAITLTLVNENDYEKLRDMLLNARDKPGDVAKQALLLKGMAGNKALLLENGPQVDPDSDREIKDPIKQLETFTSMIQDMDRDEALEQSFLGDRGFKRGGLQQRFESSCGVTTIQIVKGSSNPIYSMLMSQGTDVSGKDYTDQLGQEQRNMLGKFVGNDGLIPLGYHRQYADLPEYKVYTGAQSTLKEENQSKNKQKFKDLGKERTSISVEIERLKEQLPVMEEMSWFDKIEEIQQQIPLLQEQIALINKQRKQLRGFPQVVDTMNMYMKGKSVDDTALEEAFKEFERVGCSKEVIAKLKPYGRFIEEQNETDGIEIYEESDVLENFITVDSGREFQYPTHYNRNDDTPAPEMTENDQDNMIPVQQEGLTENDLDEDDNTVPVEQEGSEYGDELIVETDKEGQDKYESVKIDDYTDEDVSERDEGDDETNPQDPDRQVQNQIMEQMTKSEEVKVSFDLETYLPQIDSNLYRGMSVPMRIPGHISAIIDIRQRKNSHGQMITEYLYHEVSSGESEWIPRDGLLSGSYIGGTLAGVWL